MIRPVVFAAALALGGAANAASFDFTESIGTDGQDFAFDFIGPANDGGGTLDVGLNGDFTDDFADIEFATLTFGGIAGALVLGNDLGNGVLSNTIAGLSLDDSSETAFSFNDTFLGYSFSLTTVLTEALVGSGLISLDLSDEVNAFSDVNPDFVSLELNYMETATVPIPAGLPLLLGALGLMGLAVRRRT